LGGLVLEGLAEVPWARLPHAYGPADDVPGLLRGLRGSDPAVCEQALKDLFASITHQGTRYPATAPAVRFLAELATAPDTPNRHHILLLLAYAAVGTDWPSLPDGIDPGRLGDPTYAPGCAPGRQDEVPWARAAYQALAQEVPRLLGLLDDDDPRVRQATAYLIAWFPQHAGTCLRRLRRRLAAEPDPNATATMVVGLGLLAGAHRQVADAAVLAELLGGPQPLVRWAAAIALARLFVADPPEPAVAELLGWATDATPQPPEADIPFHEGELGRYALAAAVRPGAAAHQRAVEALLARLAMVGQAGEAEGLLWDLLGVTFDHDTFDMLLPRPRWEELSRLQHGVLRVVADSDRLWQRDPDDPWARNGPPPAWNPLAAHGLPDTRTRLQAYVRLEG
jgi:HEAT repeat protein